MSLHRRSIKKVTQKELDRMNERRKGYISKSLECACGAIVENVSFDAGTVECWRCVAKQVAPPHNYVSAEKRNEEKKPRGWHFMEEYISPSGKVYHKGRLVDEHSASDGKGVSRDDVRDDANAAEESHTDSANHSKSKRSGKTPRSK